MQSWFASAKRLAELAIYREDWTIGVVAQPAADIVASGITAPVNWLKPPGPGRILADPACETHPNGARTLYAECLRHSENLIRQRPHSARCSRRRPTCRIRSRFAMTTAAGC